MTDAVLAEIGIPTAGDFLQLLGPVAGVIFLNWLFHHSDEWIHRLFPLWAWERQLGWLNIQAERRAAAIFRRAGHLFQMLLAAALYGMVRSATVLGQWRSWRDPQVLRDMTHALPVFLGCLWLWAAYLGAYLIPKLKREYEEEELARYRAEVAELEQQEKESAPERLRQSPTLVAMPPLVPRPRRDG